MKNIWIKLITVICVIYISACEQSIHVNTVVHSDGSLERTVTIEKGDSSVLENNIFGIGEKSGWNVSAAKLVPGGHYDTTGQGVKLEKDEKYRFEFKKNFASVVDANNIMNPDTDSIFKIKSEFEREFRWFYTYIKYSDTYQKLNRFKDLSQDEFFTNEDYAFIERLPAEGEKISKADSLYLDLLNTKIFDIYAARGFFEEQFGSFYDLLKEKNTPSQILDSVMRKKEKLYMSVKSLEGKPDDFLIAVRDSLGIPIDVDLLKSDFNKKIVAMEGKWEFMSAAVNNKYGHSIQMPWPVVKTNADSVSGEVLFWNPPVTKLLLNDYTMTAESRKANIWAFVISGIIVLLAIIAILYPKKKV